MMFMGAFVTGMVEGPRLCVRVRCWRFKNCYVKRGFSCKCKKGFIYQGVNKNIGGEK